MVLKTAGGAGATPEQLAKINQYARRELSAEEVYLFSLVLCDNEIDRDFERFPIASLEKLAELYLGKTGIFDHNPKGESQTARIFDTAVEADPSREAVEGEEYRALRAWAYMMRCDKNADLILEIDAGIKKEVSVGCAVEKTLCSVCGADVRAKPCGHEPGKRYGNAVCYRELVNPVDAYEWSFVAVPAQKRAGVTKGHGQGFEDGDICKALEHGGLTLTDGQAMALATRLRELDALAHSGRERLAELRGKMVSLAAFALPALDARVVREVADGMDERQLGAFCKAFAGKTPVFRQFGGEVEPNENARNFGAFQI